MDSTREEAAARVKRIQGHLDAREEELAAAFEQRDWLALGYPTWLAYYKDKFGELDAKHRDAQTRRAAHVRLAAVGMSQREIAAATGVTQMTVSRDLRDETFVSPPTVELAGQPPFDVRPAPVKRLPIAEPAIPAVREAAARFAITHGDQKLVWSAEAKLAGASQRIMQACEELLRVQEEISSGDLERELDRIDQALVVLRRTIKNNHSQGDSNAEGKDLVGPGEDVLREDATVLSFPARNAR